MKKIPLPGKPWLYIPLFLISTQLHAQVLLPDLPVLKTTDTHWERIRTEHFDIVYPIMLQHKATFLADALENNLPLHINELDPERIRRITIVLDREEFTANGYVAILPRESTFYSLPGQGLNLDWYSLLAIHEGRHAVQIETANRGITRLLSLAFGDQGLIPLFFAPGWIYEGDAVTTETLYTKGGRGRDPFFTMPIKALTLNEDMPSYQSMIHGSYKAPMPNAYNMGYLLSAYLRTQYSPEAPSLLAKSIGQLPLPVAGTALGIHRAAGLFPAEFYREAYSHYRRFWTEQRKILPADRWTPLENIQTSGYRIQRDLQTFDNGSLAVWEYSYNRGSEILLLTSEGGLARRISAAPNTGISTGGGYLAWDQHGTDLKFSESSSRVLLYSLNTGKIRPLTPWGRFLSPSLDSSGEQIALLEWLPEQQGTLKILSTGNGEIYTEYPLPEGEFWQQLDWCRDEKALLYLASGSFGQYIGRLELETGRITRLVSSGEYTLKSPRAIPGGILFTSSYSGVPAIYRLMQNKAEPELLFHGEFASWSAELNRAGDGLLFVNYTGKEGSRIAVAPLSPSPLLQSSVPVLREEFYAPLPLSPETPASGKESPAREYSSEAYSFGLNGLKLHSWTLLPRSTDMLDNPEIGLTLRADSVAGTWGHEADLQWNTNEETFASSYTLLIRPYRPDLSLKAEIGSRSREAEEWTELSGTAAVELPFGKDCGTRSWSVTPGASLTASRRTDAAAGETVFEQALSLSASITGAASVQSLQPRWGVLTENYYIPESRLTTGAAILLPGITFTQGLRFSGYYEENLKENASLVPFPRGWNYEEVDRLWAVQSDYRLPLAYPDFSLGSFALFKRVWGKAFLDTLKDLDSPDRYSSAGGELNIDFHLLQLPVQLSAGLRWYYQLETGSSGFQFLVLGGGI